MRLHSSIQSRILSLSLLLYTLGSILWLISVFIGLSLALTSFFLREGFALYAIIGGDGNMCFRYWLFFINFQCSLEICLILWMSSVYRVTNTNLSVCLGFCL